MNNKAMPGKYGSFLVFLVLVPFSAHVERFSGLLHAGFLNAILGQKRFCCNLKLFAHKIGQTISFEFDIMYVWFEENHMVCCMGPIVSIESTSGKFCVC